MNPWLERNGESRRRAYKHAKGPSHNWRAALEVHCPEFGDDIGGKNVPEAGLGALSTSADGWLLAMIPWAPSRSAIKMTIAYIKPRGSLTAWMPNNLSREAKLELARRGNNAIKRLATVPASGCADGPSGSVAINEANLWVAASPGN